MTAPTTWPPSPALRIAWRTLEWWGALLALFLTSGAVFPVLLMVQNGELGDAERSKLRLLQLPIYLITLTLLARHPAHLLLAVRRTLPILALLVLAFASTLWSMDPSVTLRRAIGLAMGILLAYLLALRFTPRQILVLVSAVVGINLFLSLTVMVASPVMAFMPDGTGLRGVFTHKNVLGWAACLGTVVALGLIRDIDTRLRLAGWPLLAVSLTCLVLAGSATGIFAVAVGGALFAFYGALRRTGGLSQAILILLALELTAVILVLLGQFLVPVLDSLGKDATLTGRVPLWGLVDIQIAQRPWLGYGYQAFWEPTLQQSQWISGILQWTPPHAHNGYRDILLNFGVPGLVLFAVLIIGTIRQGAILHGTAPTAGWEWMNVMVGVTLTLNLTESNLLTPNDLLWQILMTVIASFALRSARPAPA